MKSESIESAEVRQTSKSSRNPSSRVRSKLLREFLNMYSNCVSISDAYEAEQLLKEVDIHSVTGNLKSYLRELPEALFTDQHYQKVRKVESIVKSL